MAAYDSESINIQCLTNAINETQETIRGYDVKSEILGILMTLVIGMLNFNMINDCKKDADVMLLMVLATVISLLSVVFILLVLFPSRNPVEDIDLGDYKPQGTYFLFKGQNEKFHFTAIHSKLVNTDWQKELLLELLKSSTIRERKHMWFKRAIATAAITFSVIVLLVIRINYLCAMR